MDDAYRFRFKRLDVYGMAVEHFEWTCRVVDRMPRGPFKMTNQAVGAALSIMGNIGEANGRDRQPGEVQQHYRYALGSTFEAATHIDGFRALRVIDDEEHANAEERLSRIAAMIRSLNERQRRQARNANRRKAQGAKRPQKKVAQPTNEKVLPVTEPPRESSTPRASGVPASPKGAAGIDPAPRAVPQGAKRPSGIDPRGAARRGSEATERDRPSKGRRP